MTEARPWFRRNPWPMGLSHSGMVAFAIVGMTLLGCGQDEPGAGVGAVVPGVDAPANQNSDACTGAGCGAVGTLDASAPGKGACEGRPEGSPCDDGDPCTVEDLCSSGQCAAGFEICACRTKADCADQEDGDPCNGTLYCERQTLPYTCRVNPATVVHCPTGSDSSCKTSVCSQATGQCEVIVHQDQPCDDGVPCTVGDLCNAAGSCEPGTNLCVCQKTADCAAMGQDDPCAGSYYCDLSTMPWACKINPASVVTCNAGSDTQCVKNKCAGGKCALTPLADNAACDDGDTCTQNDRCLGGKCKGGLDTCPCGNDADCAAKEDGNQCNGTLYCSLLTGLCTLNPATVVTCKTVNDTHCSATSCVPETGKCVASNIHEGDTCDDGNACTLSDTCVAGECKGGTNTCVCAQDKDCASQDDGDLCNGTMYCDKSGATPACKINPTTLITCPSVDDTACSQNKCDPKKGVCAMVPRPDGTACNADGNQCTPADACIGGKCQAGQNVCECMTDSDCLSKDDGDLCNGTLYCNKLLAQPKCVLNAATVVKCATVDDGPCAQNLCNPKVGKCAMVPAVDGKPCDDGGLCTTGDACLSGVCKGKPKSCDDNNACTFDSCQPGSGVCLHKAIDCDDGNLCTDDQCGAGDGKCVGLPKAGKCDDGDICTDNDQCKAGVCKAGTPKTCGDGEPCTTDKCDGSAGCTHVLLLAGACDDGDACSVGESCSPAGCTGGVALACDDDNPCTVDACDKKAGCAHTLKTGQCEDGNPCTADACDPNSGLCVHKPSGQCDRPPCLSDGDCKDGHCDTATFTCVPCLKHGDCGAGKVCRAHACVTGVQCSSSVQCKATGQVCDPLAQLCVDCTSAADCGGSKVCVDSTCIEKVPCSSDKQCSMVCGKSLGYCVGCNVNQDCPGAWCGPAHVCRPPMCSTDVCIGAVQLQCKADGSGFAKKACDDGNACTANTCDAAKGCTVGPVQDPQAAGKVACDDQNACTDDVCGQDGKCVHQAVVDGAPCGKGTCKAGVCRAVVDFGVGYAHVCALTQDGKAWCWGRNSEGQLGNGTTIGEAEPVAVTGGHKFTEIAVGPNNACAIDEMSKGWCWGQNNQGQLGNGSKGVSASTVPTLFQASGKLVKIAPGESVTCAVGASGEVWCAGSNMSGQLGANLPYLSGSGGQNYVAATPVKVLQLTTAVDVVSAGSTVCALTQSKKVMCWGQGVQGQLGNGASGSNHKVATPVGVLGLSDVTALSTNSSSTCALRADGSAWCWGSLYRPLLGQALTGASDEHWATTPAPLQLPKFSGLIALAVSNRALCGVKATGGVACLGQRDDATVPPGPMSEPSLVPLEVTGLSKTVAVSLSYQAACALDAHGSLRCWGDNGAGQLGRGSFGDMHDKPGTPTFDKGVKGVWMGPGATCATDSAGTFRCWGSAWDLGFGDGLVGRFAAPTQIQIGVGILGYSSLGTGSDAHRCVVKQDGSVWCWGNNDAGQLMNGLQSKAGDKPTQVPVKAKLPGKAVEVVVGGGFSCARLAAGTVRCFGGKAAYKQSDSGWAGGTSGVDVKASGPIKGLSARPETACVIDAQANLMCFGENSNNAHIYAAAPVKRHSAAALMAPGRPLCFVNNAGLPAGECSVGTGAPTMLKSLCQGYEHTCAVDGDGAVWCWGSGGQGQIGDGTHSKQDKPIKLYTYSRKAVSVHCGGYTTCALDTTGGVICWGSNSYGQVGDGSAWSVVPQSPKNLP